MCMTMECGSKRRQIRTQTHTRVVYPITQIADPSNPNIAQYKLQAKAAQRKQMRTQRKMSSL